MGWGHRGWAERLTQERRARLAAERLLEHRTRALAEARARLEAQAHDLATRLVARREAVTGAIGDVEAIRRREGRLSAELQAAREAALRAERRLWDSMETLRDGLAVFGPDRCLLAANRAWLRPFRRWPEVAPGLPYRRLLEICADHGLAQLEGAQPADWVARIAARWDAAEIAPVLLHLAEGAWIKLIEQRTRDGDFVCLALDITETVALEERLRVERCRAEAARDAKAAFLANMSHEIRTPMNGIVGMAELLCETELNEEQRLYADTIRSSGEALLQIMNDILDFARIEAGRIGLSPEPFDLERCIHEVVALQQPLARERGLALLIDFDLFLPTRVVADPGRMRQVLANLVGNAVKFTAAGHVLIRVTGVEQPDGRCDLRLTVEDTGIGIAAEHLGHVFDGFTQVDSGASRKFEGTGLGLALTRQLIVLMGGEIWVDSELERGSCFGFRVTLPVAEEEGPPLPAPRGLHHALVVDDRLVNRAILSRQLGALGIRVSACHAAAEALQRIADGAAPEVVLCAHELPGMDGVALVAALRDHGWTGPVLLLSANPAGIAMEALAGLSVTVLQAPVLRRTLMRRLSELGGAAPVAAEGAAAGPPVPEAPRRMRVLSAEDNRTNQLVLAKMLKTLDIELAFADDGRAAVAMYGSFGPDLVFMDIAMPGMDGREATRAIRAIEIGTGRHVPIVALTAHALDGDADGLRAVGLDDCLTKPLRRAAIIACIAAHAPAGVRPPTPPPGAGVAAPLPPPTTTTPSAAPPAAAVATPLPPPTPSAAPPAAATAPAASCATAPATPPTAAATAAPSATPPAAATAPATSPAAAPPSAAAPATTPAAMAAAPAAATSSGKADVPGPAVSAAADVPTAAAASDPSPDPATLGPAAPGGHAPAPPTDEAPSTAAAPSSSTAPVSASEPLPDTATANAAANAPPPLSG